MRVVVFGAGAIGGVVGARLFQHRVDVTWVARGAHAEALASGLVLESPDESVTLPIPVVTNVSSLHWTEDTVVLLAVKGQDTEAALLQLVRVAPQETPIVCMQNGVENERRVLRRFPRTYAMCVLCPASHLRPGMVVAHSAPVTGLFDLGRYPSGVDDVAEAIAETLRASTFESVARPDIMRWKYRKLIMNLINAVEALSGPEARDRALAREARREGDAVLQAAGIAVASVEEDRVRRGDLLAYRPTPSGTRAGGSSWQSLQRGSGSIEGVPQRRDRPTGRPPRCGHPGQQPSHGAGVAGRRRQDPGRLMEHRGADRGRGSPHRPVSAGGTSRYAGRCEPPRSGC